MEGTTPAVSLCDRDHCSIKATNDGLERQFHGQVKVGSDERAASIDNLVIERIRVLDS